MKTSLHYIRIYLLLLTVGIICSGSLFAQEFKTIFDSTKPLHISGFGGPIVEFSAVEGTFATSTGGGGAMILNNYFFGGYGMGLSTNNYKEIIGNEPGTSIIHDYSNVPISFGHGGFWIGGFIKPSEAIHFALSTKIGWGAISFMDRMNQNNNNINYDQYNIIDNVFVLTPQVEVEINFTHWFKLNAGLGYRIVTGTDLTYRAYSSELQYLGKKKYFNNNEFSSLTGTISFLFGGF